MGKFDRARLLRRTATTAAVASLLLGGVSAWPAHAAATRSVANPLVPAQDKPVPVHAVAVKAAPVATAKNARPTAVAWPAAGSADAHPAAAVTAAAARSSAARSTAVTPTAVTPMARAGSLPVLVGPADSATPAPQTAHVALAARSAAQALGIDGLVFSVTDPGATRAAPARIAVDYSAFAESYGGGWSSRLQLVALPACALTTPQLERCRAATPLKSVNSASAHQVSAAANLAATPQVFALSPTGSDSGGTFAATSLAGTGSWAAGGQGGSFDYSYPMAVPNVPGGLSPAVTAAYDSQSVDGRTSATNSQASWVGDGWDYSPGFIERAFAPCADNTTTATKTGDQCWSANDTYTMSLGGHSTTLVDDPASGWHGTDDAGDRIQMLTGAVNGDKVGEYWVVTEPSGTQYYFGQNQLKGWASTDATTGSAFTEPVYFAAAPPATDPDQACYNATFSASVCTLAYRWNLDYVVDTHSDALAYFYNQEINYYSPDNGKTATAGSQYVRSGTLAKAVYGFRDGQVYSASPKPGAQVLFGVNGRCDTSATGCATSTLTTGTASDWPDVPFDQNCTSGAACTSISPTFWTENELTSVQTQVLVGTAYQNVDLWKLTYAFPPTGDSTPRALWLASITRTGQDGLGGLSGGTAPGQLSLPPTTFAGQGYANRVNATNGNEPITRQRLTKITAQAGAVTSIAYQDGGCGSGTPAVDTNTTQCYPQYWTPPLTSTPILDWFNKYAVSDVTTSDPTGGGEPIYVHYTYGAGAWHHDDNPLAKAANRTWDIWHGFSTVTADSGQSSDTSPVTERVSRYMQGMDQDLNSSGGKKTATVTDSRGETITDSAWLAGRLREQLVNNGVGGAAISDDITDFWSKLTGTQSLSGSGLDPITSHAVDTAVARRYVPTSTGATRTTANTYTYDSYARVTSVDNTANGTCTKKWYAQDTSRWILNAISRVQVLSVGCSATPSYPQNVVTDTQNLYDKSATAGVVSGAGDVTTSQKADSVDASGTPHYVGVNVTSVDEYGRPLTSTDADGRVVTTAYSPATGAPPTSIAQTAPVVSGQSTGFISTSTYDPARGEKLTSTDAAGHEGVATYDSLGRVTAQWDPQLALTPSTAAPNHKYTYQVSASAPVVVTTYRLVDDGTGYVASETLLDSLFRQRETQSTTPDGNRLVSDTVYDSQSRPLLTTDPYYTAGAISSTVVTADPGASVTQNGYLYDGAGRQIANITYYAAAKQWESDTAYDGADETTITPPGGAGGGTAESTYTDAAGHRTRMVKYNGSSPSDGVATSLSYTYTPDGNIATMADVSGDKWSYAYNLLGRRISETDPDTGTTSYTYDAAGQQITATDSTGKQVTTAYDAMGRKTGLYDTTGGAAAATSNEVSSWAYDSLAKGFPTSSTSYYNGNAYTTSVIGYTTYGQSKGTTVVIPAAEGKLAGTYVHQTTYTPADQIATTHDGADAGLPAETVTYQYDAFGRPYSLTGSGTVTTAYVSNLTTTQFGQPSVFTFGTTSNPAYLDLSYDDSTGRLTGAATVTTSGGASHTADDLTYTYNQATGNVLSAQDIQSETGTQTTDTQCFGYDGLQRLTSAWTATDNCAAAPAPGNSGTVGGTNAYWQTFSYDALGDRTASTDHNTSGITADDVTTSYLYPAAGSGTAQPHTLSSTTTTGPAGSTLAKFTYDNAGDTTAISDPVNGNHTMAWGVTGKLVSDITAAGTTGYVYDAAGKLLIRHDPKTNTLYLPDEQITQDNGTSAIAQATRFYSMADSVIAARTATSAGATQDVQYLIPDRQGSDTLAIDAVTQAVTRRAFLPYGGARGAAPASWPGGDRGYVGGESDATTGIETLGARQYDPAVGRFLSADPILEIADPNQAGGYVYAGDNPTTQSDPSGKGIYDEGTGCQGTIQAVEACIRNQPGTSSSSSSSSGSGSGSGSGSSSTAAPGGSTNTTGGNTNGNGSIDPNACATLECHKELTDAAYAAQAKAQAALLNAAAKKNDQSSIDAPAAYTCPSGAGHIQCENQNFNVNWLRPWLKRRFSPEGWSGIGDFFEHASQDFGGAALGAYGAAALGIETGPGALVPATVGLVFSTASTVTSGISGVSFLLSNHPEKAAKPLLLAGLGLLGGPAGGGVEAATQVLSTVSPTADKAITELADAAMHTIFDLWN